MMEDPAYRQAWADSDLPMLIAFELCDARRRAGLTRAELAQLISVAEDEIAKWEKGSGTIPSLHALRDYAEATGSQLRITLTSGS
jgi:transcriptional regulator with XRE-family HTH domain